MSDYLPLHEAVIAELPNYYRGKVRENYDLPDGRRILISTDRLSAFDRAIASIPLKGQVLTQTARFWFERTGPARLIDAIGVNNVMFETDFPHPTCLYTDALERVAGVMADASPHVVRRVLQDNAAELYRIAV